jgi:plastocyanin
MSPLASLRPSRPRTLALAGLSGLALLTGCGSSDDSSSTSTPAAATSAPAAATSAAQSGTVKIAYKDYSIAPADVTVKPGSKLVWTNEDPSVHNVVFKDGDPEKFTSEDLKKGETATFSPTKPGVYKYLCTFHAGSMQGTITVQ